MDHRSNRAFLAIGLASRLAARPSGFLLARPELRQIVERVLVDQHAPTRAKSRHRRIDGTTKHLVLFGDEVGRQFLLGIEGLCEFLGRTLDRPTVTQKRSEPDRA